MEHWATVGDLCSRERGWTRQRVLDACDLLDAIAEASAEARAEASRR